MNDDSRLSLFPVAERPSFFGKDVLFLKHSNYNYIAYYSTISIYYNDFVKRKIGGRRKNYLTEIIEFKAVLFSTFQENNCDCKKISFVVYCQKI